MQALIGVQFLLHRSQLWEENAPRMFSLTGSQGSCLLEGLCIHFYFLLELTVLFTFADELNPLSSLVSRWRKIEFECWPTLLDAVERHHEVDAEKVSYKPDFVIKFEVL
jgi:hypothetical protein